MTRLRFVPRLPGGRPAPAGLTIEVRKPNQALVARALSSEEVEIPPGSYFVTVCLPDGQEVSLRVEIGEDTTRVPLPLDDSDPPPVPVPQVRDHFLLRRLAPKLPMPQVEAVFRSLPTLPDAESPAAAWEMPRLPPFLGWELPQPAAASPQPAGPMLRLFAGNPLAGPLEPRPGWPGELPALAEDAPGAAAEIAIHGEDRPLLVQLLQPELPPLDLAVPAWQGVTATLSVARSPEGLYTLAFRLAHSQAELLLRYREQGRLRAAEAAAGSPSLDAERLLRSKGEDPVAAAVGAYALLRFGDLDRLHDWTENLRQWYPGLPDGAAIRGEHLARLGRHREALASFLDLPARGLPLFSDGLAFALERLRLYTGAGAGAFEPAEAAAARDLLDRLQPFVDAVDFGQPVTTWTGLDPSQPDAEVLPSRAADYGREDLEPLPA